MFKRSLIVIIFIVAASVIAVAQTATPQPPPPQTPQPTPPPVPQNETITRNALLRRTMDGNVLVRGLSPTEEIQYRHLIALRYIDPLYRKPTKKELKAVTVDPKLTAKYGSTLSLPKTNIFKLIRDHGCDKNASVVSVSEACQKYSMPGGGNSYSFRAETYRLRRIADISFQNDSLVAPGFFMHGVFVQLGNVDISGIGLGSAGIPALIGLAPATTTKEAIELGSVIKKGFERDGYVYGNDAAIKVNTTYALRSIAYRGKVMRAVVGATYNELDRDKRRDVVTVFRIVDIDPDGSLTIIWRELRNIEAPELKNEN